LLVVAIFAPVVLWNVEHSWFLVEITLNRQRWIGPRSVPENLLLFAGAQLLYHGVLAPVLVGAVLAGLRRFKDPAWRYLAWMSLPILAVAAVAAMDARPKPHWPSPAYLAGALALGALWEEWARKSPRLLWGSVGLTALVTGALVVVVLLPWGVEQVRSGIGRWDLVAGAVERQALTQSDPALVLTDNYQAASHIAYYLRRRVPVTTFYGAFIVWERPEEWSGWRAIYVDEESELPSLDIGSLCRDLRQVESVELAPGRVVRLYRCDGVRISRPPGASWAPIRRPPVRSASPRR
jgi:hypothetical protein